MLWPDLSMQRHHCLPTRWSAKALPFCVVTGQRLDVRGPRPRVRKPASPSTARPERWILVLAGSFGVRNLLFLCHVCTRLLVARLFMDDTFRIDGEHLIDRLPSVARAFLVSTPPTAALQIDVELRVD